MCDQVKIYGIWHKIGVHGFVYMLINGVWIRSTKEAREVLVRLK